MERSFQIPPEASEAANLLTEQKDATKIAPKTPVLCINRGNRPLIDTFNGVHVPIPVGYFKTEYGAAKHFQRRLIVPGTRNLQVGGFQSFIGILGTVDGQIQCDKPEECQRFTDEELTRFGEQVEGIDRRTVIGAGQDVVPQPVSSVLARSPQFGSVRPQIEATVQASEEAAAAAEHVFDTPGESATREAEAEAGGARGGGRRGRGRG